MLGLTHEEFGKWSAGHDFNVSSCKLIRRPDMLFKMPKFAILLEIDEHGHRYYTELEELEHLDVIRRWVLDTYGLNHMYVLRVNPDGREPPGGSEKLHVPTGNRFGDQRSIAKQNWQIDVSN